MNSRDPGLPRPGPTDRALPDVQGSADERRQPIERVGVRGLRRPMHWRSEGAQAVPTVAVWNLFVSLPAEQKGTHMSRFVALLERRGGNLSIDALAPLHDEMLALLEADRGRIEIAFPLFVSKTAPVSGVESTMDYEIGLAVDGTRGAAHVDVRIVVPVTSLCPCSREISDYGAHNQRSHVTVDARLAPGAAPALPALIARIEAQASCELWGLLKRADEKLVTERAYDNPKFVEDLVRDVAATMRAVPGIASFVVEGENFESIHNHSAYARIVS